MYGAVYVKSAAKLVSLLIFVGWFIVRTFDVYFVLLYLDVPTVVLLFEVYKAYYFYKSSVKRSRRGRDHLVVGFKSYLCNQCLSPLML